MKTPCLVLCASLVCLAQTNGGLIPDNVLNGLLSAPTQLNNAVKNAITFKESEEDERPLFLSPPQVSTTLAPAAATTAKPATTTVASATKSATEKDGRENFAGGCSTGFKRTPDGRCMPTI